MTQPAKQSAPQPEAEADAPSNEVFLGTGAYGDPAKPELSRKEFIELEQPEEQPNNPSSDPVLVVTPSGAAEQENVALPVADSTPTTVNPTAPPAA